MSLFSKKCHFCRKKTAGGSRENLKQGLGAAARPAAAAARPEGAAARPGPPRRPGAAGRPKYLGFSKNAPGASGGLRGLPLSPPVPLVGPLGPQRAQKSPGGLMGPLGPPWAPAALWDLREAQCTLVLPQRGIAIFGGCVCGVGVGGSASRLSANLPAPGSRPAPAARLPPGAAHAHVGHNARASY